MAINERMRFEVLFIDFYGTIADGDRHAVESTCGGIVRDFNLPMSAAEFAERWGRVFFATADTSNHHQFRRLYDCEIISLEQMFRDFGIDADPAPYVAQLLKYWRNPPLHGEAKRALSRVSVPVCCVSNVDEHDLGQAAHAHGLKFDHVVTSERARSYKPDATIFELALDEMGVPPDRAVHVGDSLHSDVAGAQAVGIYAVWIHRDGRISDIGDAQPDCTIRSLIELSEIFA